MVKTLLDSSKPNYGFGSIAVMVKPSLYFCSALFANPARPYHWIYHERIIEIGIHARAPKGAGRGVVSRPPQASHPKAADQKDAHKKFVLLNRPVALPGWGLQI